MTGPTTPHVLIVGGGVAALETLIALRDLAGDRVTVTLVAPETNFTYRPMTVAQPFHLGRRERAIADHIPRVFDRLLELLAAQEDLDQLAETPATDPDYLRDAREHAKMRAAQGLTAADVTVEFRLLRHQIWAALRRGLSQETTTGNLIGAELLINDAIDGATGVALNYYQQALEEALDDFIAIAAHDLGNVRRVIQRESEERGVEGEGLRRAEIDADVRRGEVKEEELDQQRRIAKDLDVAAADPTERRDRSDPQDRDERAENEAPEQAEDRKLNGDPQPARE